MPDKKDQPSAAAETNDAASPAAKSPPPKPRFDPAQLKGKGGQHGHQSLTKAQSFFRPRGR